MRAKFLILGALLGTVATASAETTIHVEDAKCAAEIKAACLTRTIDQWDCSAYGGNWIDRIGGPPIGPRQVCRNFSKSMREHLCAGEASKAATCWREVKLADSADQKAMLEQFRKEHDERLKAVLQVLKESGAVAAPAAPVP